jgi:hypothetical protein
VSGEGRVCVGEQKQSLGVIAKVGESLAILVIVDMDIQAYNDRSDLKLHYYTDKFSIP